MSLAHGSVHVMYSVCRAIQPAISLGLLSEVFKHWIQGTAVVIMDIPLLFEMKMNYLTHPVVVVWVDRATQEARLTKRDSSAIVRTLVIAKLQWYTNRCHLHSRLVMQQQ